MLDMGIKDKSQRIPKEDLLVSIKREITNNILRYRTFFHKIMEYIMNYVSVRLKQ